MSRRDGRAVGVIASLVNLVSTASAAIIRKKAVADPPIGVHAHLVRGG
jgi:hypothetical protein